MCMCFSGPRRKRRSRADVSSLCAHVHGHVHAAQEAVKLVGTYVGNLAIDVDNPAKRRINAANKVLARADC